MGLGSLTDKFQQLASAIITSVPSRDALARERDGLLAAPPPAPASMLQPPEPPSCRCEHCTTRAHEEQAARVTLAAWEGRVKALEVQLHKKTYGAEDERDEPGQALARLRADLMKAFDQNRARQWERVVEYDGRGKPTRAFETAAAIGEVSAILIGLIRAAGGPLVFLGSAELAQAITETRQRMVAALAAPLERPLAPEVAARAGTQAGEATEAERHGLVPGGTPDVIGGTVRFSRRGRA